MTREQFIYLPPTVITCVITRDLQGSMDVEGIQIGNYLRPGFPFLRGKKGSWVLN